MLVVGKLYSRSTVNSEVGVNWSCAMDKFLWFFVA